MTELELYADVANRKLVTRDGGAVTLPTVVLGDTLRCKLTTYQRTEAGDLREIFPHVRALRAAWGRNTEPPTAGNLTFRLNGGATIGPIAHNTTADALKTAINGAGLGFTAVEVLLGAPACWLIRFSTAGEKELEAVTNLLRPAALPRWTPYEEGGVLWHELRLVQLPLSWNVTGHERVLADPPTVSRVLDGRAETATEPAIDELQALHLPSDFRGTYFLRWEGRVSAVLGIEDGPEEIADALNAMWKDGKRRFEGSNPEADHAYLKFIGPLAGEARSLIVAEVNTFAPGKLTFVLPFDRPEAASALRAVTTLDLPLEIEIETVPEADDILNPAIAGDILTAQQTMKVVRQQITPEIGAVPEIDWLRPYKRDYQGFTPDQIITGAQQAYETIRGNGVAAEFVCDHGLATSRITGVTVTDTATGLAMIHGGDYQWTVNSPNTVTVTALGDPPALNGWRILIDAAGPASAFQAHTHTIGQIVGLQAALDAANARLDAIEGLLPGVPATREEAEAEPQEIPIPSVRGVFPGQFSRTFDFAAIKADGTGLPKARTILLGALHSSVENLIYVIGSLPAPTAGRVYYNNGATDIVVPRVGGGIKASVVKPGGFVGYDGRVWYRLTQDVAPSATRSFFPTDYERELFRLPINPQMLRAGQTLRVEGKLTAALFQSETIGQMFVVIETGVVVARTTPSPTGENIEAITWNATPLASLQINLAGLALTHEIGAEIIRDETGVFFANQLRYGKWEAAGSVPAGDRFLVRARLVQVDIEDAVQTSARGFLFYDFANAKAGIS